MTNIGESTFYFCKSLTNINIPDGVTNIGDDAFKYCWSLTKINIPNSVTYIGKCTFMGCKNILPQIKSDIKNVWANYISNRIQAQEARKHIEEIP